MWGRPPGLRGTPWSRCCELTLASHQADVGVGLQTRGSAPLFHLPRDDFLHDLRRTRAYAVETHVAPETPNRILGDVAETAEHLHAVVDDSLREIGGVQL